MEANFFTRLEKAGGQGILRSSATLDERRALSHHVMTLQGQGHALTSDITSDGDVMVIHYLTCVKCRGEKNG